MKSYSAQLIIKQNGTKNRIKLKAKHLTEEATDELKELFVHEMILDPSRMVKSEMLEGLENARKELADPTPLPREEEKSETSQNIQLQR